MASYKTRKKLKKRKNLVNQTVNRIIFSMMKNLNKKKKNKLNNLIN